MFNDDFATCENPNCYNALIAPEDIATGTCSEDCAIVVDPPGVVEDEIDA